MDNKEGFKVSDDEDKKLWLFNLMLSKITYWSRSEKKFKNTKTELQKVIAFSLLEVTLETLKIILFRMNSSSEISIFLKSSVCNNNKMIIL